MNNRFSPPARTGRLFLFSLTILTAFLLLPREALAQSGGADSPPQVRAVLFYSPSCPHCHDVIDNNLPPLLEQYGEQLAIIGVNTAHPDGQALYQAAVESFNIPPGRRGVPALIIGETVLVGSLEIPELLPGLIEEFLAAGGVPWPDIPGLEAALPAESAAPPPTPAPSAPAVEAAPPQSAAANPQPEPLPDAPPPLETGPALGVGELAAAGESSVWEIFRRDLAANSLAVLVLLIMISAAGLSAWWLFPAGRPASTPIVSSRSFAWIPFLVVVGLLVSGYMAYVEMSQSPAVCGPLGDCNTVQQSPYARLFGLLPIGLLGVAGYLALGITWFLARRGESSLAHRAARALPLMALAGTLFSIYLTFLEPFVIGATCMWCLTSAVVITLILALSTPPPARTIAAEPG